MGRSVLFLTQTYPRHAGDTCGPFIRDLARGLVRAGDRVTVLVPHAEGVRETWDDDGVTVESFRYAPVPMEVVGYSRSLEDDERVRGGATLMAPLYGLSARRAVRRAVRSRRYDLVHAHWVVPNGLVAAAALRADSGADGPPPLAVGLHGSDVFLAEKPGVRRLVRATLRRTRLLTGCSPELVSRVEAIGFEGGIAEVIPYGVDVEVFCSGPQRRAIWRQRLEIPSAATVLLGVGRMATKKGFHVLVDVLPKLLIENPHLHVILAGGGDREDEFRRLTADWAARVHFPGVVEHDALPDLYRCADLFVLPAVHDAMGNVDGLPNVILEAMASALPVVATDTSGIPLAVRSGEEGLLVAEGDGAELAAALRQLIGDPETRRHMGDAGRRRAEADLTWDAVAARYRGAYDAALATPEWAIGRE